jgi:hypothetical protein
MTPATRKMTVLTSDRDPVAKPMVADTADGKNSPVRKRHLHRHRIIAVIVRLASAPPCTRRLPQLGESGVFGVFRV